MACFSLGELIFAIFTEYILVRTPAIIVNPAKICPEIRFRIAPFRYLLLTVLSFRHLGYLEGEIYGKFHAQQILVYHITVAVDPRLAERGRGHHAVGQMAESYLAAVS